MCLDFKSLLKTFFYNTLETGAGMDLACVLLQYPSSLITRSKQQFYVAQGRVKGLTLTLFTPMVFISFSACVQIDDIIILFYTQIKKAACSRG